MGSSNPLFGSAWGQKVMKNVDGYFLPNASSACSPAVLSPEERPSLLTRRQNTASTNGGIIPSVPDCMSINKSADALPVLSPSNDLSLERAICDSLFQTSFDRESSDSRASSFPNPETPILSPTQIRAKEDPVLVSIVEGLGFTLPSVGHSDTRWWVSNPLRPSETSGMGDQQLSNDIESQVGGGNQPGPSAPPGSFGRNDRAFLRQNVGIITPPAENNDIGWGDTKISNHLASTPNFDLQIEDASPPSGDQHTPADEAASVVAAATAAGELIEHWLQPALVSLVSSVDVSGLSGNSVQILSQALPLPLIPGSFFPLLINSIRLRLPPSPVMWINVLHAIPGRLSLSDLPSPRPTTPAQPVGGEDYFSTKVYESAVPAIDYEAELVAATPNQNVNGLAPPGSIHAAMVERYIPPSSSKELAELFTFHGSSLLVDRMVELSPNNGSLIFIYPTRRGGQVFEAQYLGPVLDPLLRSMVVLNELSSEFSTSLGSMASVRSLYTFEDMHQKITSLCEALNGNTPSSADRLHGMQSLFSLAYASMQHVSLDRKVWSDWWVRQEKLRIRKGVLDYFRMSKNLPGGEHGKPETHQGSFVQSILDGVARRPARVGPSDKIEVGVFVIKRSNGRGSS